MLGLGARELRLIQSVLVKKTTANKSFRAQKDVNLQQRKSAVTAPVKISLKRYESRMRLYCPFLISPVQMH